MWVEDYIELLELQQIIKAGVEDSLPGPVRVRAEVASIQHKANGHCYLELCQSDNRGLTAKVRGIIWKSRAEVLLGKYAEATGAPLQPGMAIIMEVQVNYSELYGVSLIIEDIDCQATLGEAELRRRQTSARLEKEGLLDLQKEFALPALPYSLAVISARDAAGYGDFRRHLLENEYGFAFEVTLFEATMQGDSAPASIISALQRILDGNGHNSERSDRGSFEGTSPRPLGVQGDKVLLRSSFEGTSPRPLGVQGDEERLRSSHYDAVLILRGGGSVLDLACFDDYDLCAAIATFPVPVCTAIGHDRDSHAADRVSCISVKTPTALADLFIDAVAAEDERITSLQTRLRLAINAKLARMEDGINSIEHRVKFALVHLLTAADASLSKLETRIVSANPRILLQRGYSLVTGPTGALLRSADGAVPGDRINVLFPDGTLNCTVNGKV
jgi:exodeoxyribonuclease VII large subunit